MAKFILTKHAIERMAERFSLSREQSISLAIKASRGQIGRVIQCDGAQKGMQLVEVGNVFFAGSVNERGEFIVRTVYELANKYTVKGWRAEFRALVAMGFSEKQATEKCLAKFG